MDVEVRIDGKIIKLVPNGIYMGCKRFETPKRGGHGDPKGLVASVLVKPDWQPEKKEGEVREETIGRGARGFKSPPAP